MMTQDKLLGALGLCRRAGALAVGADEVQNAVRAKRAKLVLCAQDLSAGSLRRVRTLCEGRCQLVQLPLEKAALTGILHKPVGVLAVTNDDLAVLCRANLPQGGGVE